MANKENKSEQWKCYINKYTGMLHCCYTCGCEKHCAMSSFTTVKHLPDCDHYYSEDEYTDTETESTSTEYESEMEENQTSQSSTAK